MTTKNLEKIIKESEELSKVTGRSRSEKKSAQSIINDRPDYKDLHRGGLSTSTPPTSKPSKGSLASIEKLQLKSQGLRKSSSEKTVRFSDPTVELVGASRRVNIKHQVQGGARPKTRNTANKDESDDEIFTPPSVGRSKETKQLNINNQFLED